MSRSLSTAPLRFSCSDYHVTIPPADCFASSEGMRDRVISLAATHDGRFLGSVGRDRTIRLWSLEKLNTGRDAEARSINRWGATFRLADDGVEIESLVEAGPLYTPGLRAGDKLVQLSWTEDDANGNRQARQTNDPQAIRERLLGDSWINAYGFWYRPHEVRDASRAPYPIERRPHKIATLLDFVVLENGSR